MIGSKRIVDPEVAVADAGWLPHRIDATVHAIEFVHLSRQAHRQATFLDDKYLAKVEHPRSEALPVAALAKHLPPARPAVGYIFHSAFCGSTLLAKAFDIPGVAMGLKEPAILNQMASLQRAGQLSTPIADATMSLLVRPFPGDQINVIKPSNEANVLIDRLIAAPATSAILLYSPIQNFLQSVAKKGMWGRLWARRLFPLLQRNTGRDFGYSGSELFEQTDLQIAALGWLMQQGQFAQLIRQTPEKVRSLDSETFLAAPGPALSAAARLFGVPLHDREVEAIVQGPVFASHSKEAGRSYNSNVRFEEQARNSPYDEEVAMISEWTSVVAAHAGIPLELGNPLLTP